MQYNFPKDRVYDIIAIGRACIDLNATEYNRPMEETMTFTKYVGGSPANISIGSSRLGLKAGFIGKISDDQHGRFIQPREVAETVLWLCGENSGSVSGQAVANAGGDV